MAEFTTPRMKVRRWTEGTDGPSRQEFDDSHANLEARAAGWLEGNRADRPVASDEHHRFTYYARDTNEEFICVDTSGAGAYTWITVTRVALPGVKLVSDPPATYPEGQSIISVTTGQGWPTAGLAETNRAGNYVAQRLVSITPGGTYRTRWRSANLAGGNAWNAWMVDAAEAAVPGALPVGAIIPYGGETAPPQYIFARGQALSRSTYSLLFSVFGTKYGAGDGVSTFNVPNLQGRVVMGMSTSDIDHALGATGGAKFHTLTVDQLPAHAHGSGVRIDSGGAG